jgi:hypothetical protein
MSLRDSLRRLGLFVILAAAACQLSDTRDDRFSAASASVEADDTVGDQAAVEADGTAPAQAAVEADNTAAGQAYRRRVCERGIKRCSAAQEGQVCDPAAPFFVCSRQDNGGFCCIPFAQQ